jgi:FkbM family methyltransferase
MELDFRDHTARRYYLYGKPERGVAKSLLSLLSPGMTFMDVGSNWGYYALMAARAVGPSGRVVAFEPHPQNVARIRRNLELNPGLGVAVEALAVSDGDGTATLTEGSDSGKGTILAEPDNPGSASIEVRTVSLDNYLAANGIDTVHVMKMDIEGAEVLALEGLADGLRSGRYGQILIEWHGAFHGELGERPRAALQLLESAGYELLRIRRHGRGKVDPIAVSEVADERMHLLCRPRGSE